MWIPSSITLKNISGCLILSTTCISSPFKENLLSPLSFLLLNIIAFYFWTSLDNHLLNPGASVNYLPNKLFAEFATRAMSSANNKHAWLKVWLNPEVVLPKPTAQEKKTTIGKTKKLIRNKISFTEVLTCLRRLFLAV